MKKTAVILTALIVAMSFCACGDPIAAKESPAETAVKTASPSPMAQSPSPAKEIIECFWDGDIPKDTASEMDRINQMFLEGYENKDIKTLILHSYDGDDMTEERAREIIGGYFDTLNGRTIAPMLQCYMTFQNPLREEYSAHSDLHKLSIRTPTEFSEMYFSLYKASALSNDMILALIYCKTKTGWKLYASNLSYTAFGSMDINQLYKKAQTLYEDGCLATAVLFSSLFGVIDNPDGFLEYDGASEREEFSRSVLDEFKASEMFPSMLDESRGIELYSYEIGLSCYYGMMPLLKYSTQFKLDESNFESIEKEAREVHAMLAEAMPGLMSEFNIFSYNALFAPPDETNEDYYVYETIINESGEDVKDLSLVAGFFESGNYQTYEGTSKDNLEKAYFAWDESTPKSIADEIHAINDEIIQGLSNSDPMPLIRNADSEAVLFGDDLSDLLAFLSENVKEGDYTDFMECFVRAQSINMPFNMELHNEKRSMVIGISSSYADLYYSGINMKIGREDVLLSLLYALTNYGWKVIDMQVGYMGFDGKTLNELFEESKAIKKNGYLIPATLYSELIPRYAEPATYITYTNMQEMHNYFLGEISTLREQYPLPRTFEQIPGVSIQSITLKPSEWGLMPVLAYLSDIEISDENAQLLQYEAFELHRQVIEIYPGLFEEFDIFLYKATNEVPDDWFGDYQHYRTYIDREMVEGS